MAAISFISDASTLTAIMSDVAQKTEVIAAAKTRLENLKSQERIHQDELRRQEAALNEEQKAIMPRDRDIQE